MPEIDTVLDDLKKLVSKDPVSVAQKRGVPAESVLGVSTSDLRKLAKTLNPDIDLAKQL